MVKVPSEKRKRLRIDLEIKIKLNPVKTDSKIYGWIQDLSSWGLRIRTEIPPQIVGILKEGDKVKFETYEDFLKIRGQGMIKWIWENMAGVKFEGLDNESKKSLEEFLRICFRKNA